MQIVQDQALEYLGMMWFKIMVVQVIYLEKYDWLIKAFYEATSDDADLILEELDQIDCEPHIYYNAAEMLENNYLDTGFTYTTPDMRVTFIVMMESSCADEFQNTLDHEKGHAAQHIGYELNLDYEGEEIQYLQGEIGREMFKVAKRFMCDNCRIDIDRYEKLKLR